ncbi:MAG: mandelate racemase/muconate lactonizing enzyme family protein [Dethiobacteria bacterium]|nr:mandelate racemase/muconate lactonizing enzyme family protein [Bacillota bacterium]HHX74464.1 mandelate racemase/muconate lactonizing enzyme family protein [Bacillota bacterium]HOA36238.1 mandelate racemase/muconate lactonizing enzyme family protein [Bacillota bacterium]
MKKNRKGDPRIIRIELTPVFVPFHGYVREAMRAAGGLGMAIPAEEDWLGGDFVVCRLTAEDGSTGLGEVFVWLPETGVSPGQVILVIKEALGKYLLGESPFNIERIRHRMEINVARNEVAKGLLDMACYDLMGRIAGRPACDFMGGRTVERVPLAALVPLGEPARMAELARFFYTDGIRTFRLKLGGDIAADVEILKEMRRALGGEARLRVDYNQACRSAAHAVRAIKAIEPFGIEFVEQPLPLYNYLEMAEVQKRVDTPLMAHEDCFSLQDIVTLIELKAVGVVGLNPERPGGITAALRALDYAARRGLGAVLHNQPLGINSAAVLHLAAARHHQLGYATELFGHVMLEDDLITAPIDYSGGAAAVPAGPGWGVELDEAALQKYATGPATVLGPA